MLRNSENLWLKILLKRLGSEEIVALGKVEVEF